MADIATPSAATMGTINAGADKPEQASSRPTKPDDDTFKAALEKANKVFEAAQKKVADAQARVSGSTTSTHGDSQSHYKQLVEQIKDVRSKQGEFRNARQSNQDRIKALDGQLKAKMTEQKADRQKIPFNSVAAIDDEIKRIEASVESGKLKMVEERKALDSVSSLRKQRKGFGSMDQRNKEIDELKAQIASLKQPVDRPEQKQLETEYERLDKELKTIKEADQAKRGDLNTARDALRAARDAREAAYQDRKKLQDEYYNQKREYRKYEQEAYKIRDQKRKIEREAYQRGRKEEALKRKVEEASLPAYGDELRAAESIIHLIEPSSASGAATSAPGQFAAHAQRTVDDAGIKGMRLSKKGDDEENYFIGTGGKKNKKGGKKTSGSTEPATSTGSRELIGKLWAPGSMEQFALLKLDPPTDSTDVPAILEKVKEKRKFFLEDRDRKTQENIEKAKKEFDALEAENEKAAAENGNGASANGADEAASKLSSTQINDPKEGS